MGDEEGGRLTLGQLLTVALLGSKTRHARVMTVAPVLDIWCFSV
jgi:hypothetical protein